MLELCVLYIYRAYCIIVDLFYRAYSIVNLFTNFRAFLDKFLSILTALCPVYIIIPINVGPRNKSIHLIIGEHITMECYATPWPLWRESWILWHIVEPSFAFGASLSLSPSLIALSFLSLGGLIKEGVVIYNSFLYWIICCCVLLFVLL